MMSMLIVRLLSCTLHTIWIILSRILLFIRPKKPSVIQSDTNPLFKLSATTLAKKIRHREITSYEVVDKYIERIKTVNGIINAVVDQRFTEAIYEAKICDEQLQANKFDVETLEKEKPLYGVPFTCKECCAVNGLSHTGFTKARYGFKASRDSDVVALLRNAGGIPLCVTNTPEMCGGIDTANKVYGRTFNSYDTRYTVGGSSGGEGALLGTGVSLFGIGSDLGGSIRLPAYFNGVFGHKPTPGIISVKGHFPMFDDENFKKYLVVGPLTRYAEDLMLVMKILTSKCDRDLHLDVPVDLKRLRVYYQQNFKGVVGVHSPTLEIQECILKSAKHFEKYGIPAEKLPIEWPENFLLIIRTMFFAFDSVPSMLIDVKNPENSKNPYIEAWKIFLGLSPYTKSMLFFSLLMKANIRPSNFTSPQMVQGQAIRQKIIDLLGDNGVFIFPTFRIPATFPSLMLLESFNLPYTMIFNIFGFPSVQVPMGLNRDGLPIGFQVVAAPYQDRLCLAVAKELETAFGGWKPPPYA